MIFSGPSGVGKDTVLSAWQDTNPRVRRVVSYTTRSPREGEKDGEDYHFVSQERFRQMIDEGAFLEHKEVHGNCYGTPTKDMERMLAEGLVAVLKIDVQGAAEAIRLRPDAVTVFLLPPNPEALEQRIRSRGTDSEEAIQRRLDDSRMELAAAPSYRHQLVNDDVGRVVRELNRLVSGPPAWLPGGADSEASSDPPSPASAPVVGDNPGDAS